MYPADSVIDFHHTILTLPGRSGRTDIDTGRSFAMIAQAGQKSPAGIGKGADFHIGHPGAKMLFGHILLTHL